MRPFHIVTSTVICLISTVSFAQNFTISSFSKAKDLLLKSIYFDYHKTVYCGAEYDPKNKAIISFPEGFDQTVLNKRSVILEYEHIVPAENFGRFFKEWREGHPLCVKKGKPFKGRKCAEKVNTVYALMQADMYNLYPAIGSVNGARSNYPFTELPENIPSTFGSCAFKIADRKAEPPAEAKGIVARTTLYFAESYAGYYKLSAAQQKLMERWAATYPVTEWECTRTARIEKIQKSENRIVKEACVKANLWPN